MSNLAATLESLLGQKYISDIHLTVGEPVWFRAMGTMQRMNDTSIDAVALKGLLETLGLKGNADELAMPHESGKDGKGFAASFGQFRLRGDLVFAGQRKLSLVLRKLEAAIPSVKDIGLPPALIAQSERPTGLVLITGATGSGKSTTLASLLQHLNTSKSGHIITVEDPVEYPLSSNQCKVTTREIGLDKDASSFSAALRSAMREDPDIIMIGEIRDYETIRAAFSAAETGHLVFATLHTNSAVKTIDRVLSFFPADEKDWASNVFSTVLNCVMSQVLIPRQDGQGRVLGYELMINDSAIASSIRDKKVHTLQNQITNSGTVGSMLMNKHLQALVKDKTITKEAALAVAYDPKALAEELKRV